MASNVPWCDTPFALIPTPGRGGNVKNLPQSVFIARDMCCAHNNMLRSLNSIYQQCIHVSEVQDIRDLLKYAEFWCGWIYEHHEGEETFLFPCVEDITGVKDLMEKNVAQHHAFLPGLEELSTYVNTTKVGEYDGKKLRSIIEEFGHKLTEHLTDEIQTLLALKEYDSSPKLMEAYNKFDLEMRKGDKVRATCLRSKQRPLTDEFSPFSSR